MSNKLKPRVKAPEVRLYPKILNGRQEHVRYPVQIEAKDLLTTPVSLTIGKWMAVKVALPKGFIRLTAPVQFDTEKECREACKAHNSYAGYDDAEVEQIVSKSMGFKLFKRRKKK